MPPPLLIPRRFSIAPLCRLTVAAVALCVLPLGRGETLTLDDCLRETAAHNPLIITQQLEVERATATRLILRARALPTLQIGGILGYQGEQTSQDLGRVAVLDPATGLPVVGANGKPKTRDLTVERSAQFILLGTGIISQPVFDVSIPPSWRRGTVGILAAQENYYTVASTQLYRTRTLFYRALYQQQSGSLLRQIDGLLADNVKAQTALVNAGLKGRQNLLSSQVQRTNFSPQILSSTGTYRTNLVALLQIMGREPGMGAGGDDPVARITLGGTLEETAIDFDVAAAAREALERRPDLRALRAQVRASTEDARIVRGGYYPRVRVYVAGELLPQSFVRSSRPNAVRSSDQVQTSEIRPGVRGEWNVIDTGTVRGEARRLDAVREEFEVNLHRLEQNIPGELAGVRAVLNASASTLAVLRGNVDTAQNTLNIINTGLAQGVNSQLEFIDAQNGVLGTRGGLLAAALNLSLARAEFDRITGRYLHFVTDEPPASSRK